MPTDADHAIALLRYANYAKVADALLVSRAAVAGWAHGRNVTPYRLRQLEQLLRPDLQVQQESAPAWAEALADETAKKVIGALAPADLLEAAGVLIARLEGLRLPPDGSPPSPGAAAGRGGAVPPVREAG